MKYFSMGYLVNVIRASLPKMGGLAKKPQKVFNLLFSMSNVRFGLFIGLYVTTYRVRYIYTE